MIADYLDRLKTLAYAVLAALVVTAAGVATALHPGLVGVMVAAACVSVAVWQHPWLAAVLIIAVTPLVAGIDRGRLVPGLRPNEALAVFLGGVLILRWVTRLPLGRASWPRISRLELSLVLMALANSASPMVWMAVRGQQITGDDLSYALVLWKYIAVYALVRFTVESQHAVRWCLWASIAAASLVGVVGFLQARDLLGMRGLLLGYYAPFGYTGALAQPRGGSTVGLPAATADLLLINLALVAGLWWKDRRHPVVLAGSGLLCVLGTLAAAEFSSFLGLVIAIVCMAWVLGRLDLLRWSPVVFLGALVLVWPLVQHRLVGFQVATGLPVSWTTRWTNLRTYFWPELFSGWNPVLGVRPAARVVVEQQGTGFVWIESGYTWLLWGGGVPLVAAFIYFVRVSWSTLLPRARRVGSYSDVASLGAFTGVVVIVVLMIFDPHLTYRAAADCLFSLLALAVVARQPQPEVPAPDIIRMREVIP